MPAFSELFSHAVKAISENQRILHAVDTVMPYCSQDTISLFDRGGDRQILFDAHLQAGRQFIVRQKGNCHLISEGKAHAFGYLTVKTQRQQFPVAI